MLSSPIFSSIRVLTMGIQRVNLGVMISPELKKALERQAAAEDKTTSRLCEVMLQWSFEQLRSAGDSFTLKKWEARPRMAEGTEVPGAIDEKSYRRELRRQVLTDAKRVELAEKVGRGKGQRPHSKPPDEQEKTTTQSDRDRTSSG